MALTGTGTDISGNLSVNTDAAQIALYKKLGLPGAYALTDQGIMDAIKKGALIPYTGDGKVLGETITAPGTANDTGINATGTDSTGNGGGGTVDKDAATRAKLRARIAASGQGIDAAYQDLFGQLENLIKSRDAQLEEQYGKQFKTASDTYAASIPDIENSYAAIGASDSTDQADAKTKADKGFQDTTATIGENKAKDKAALGQYDLEQKAKIGADKAAAQQAVSSAGDTTDVSSLLSLANGLDTNLSNTGVTKATLAPDASAQQDITSLTADNGRYQSAIDALDSVIKSSMSGATKAAAVKAITDSSGLSEAEKKKVNDLYGNVYSEQAAL